MKPLTRSLALLCAFAGLQGTANAGPVAMPGGLPTIPRQAPAPRAPSPRPLPRPLPPVPEPAPTPIAVATTPRPIFRLPAEPHRCGEGYQPLKLDFPWERGNNDLTFGILDWPFAIGTRINAFINGDCQEATVGLTGAGYAKIFGFGIEPLSATVQTTINKDGDLLGNYEVKLLSFTIKEDDCAGDGCKLGNFNKSINLDVTAPRVGDFSKELSFEYKGVDLALGFESIAKNRGQLDLVFNNEEISVSLTSRADVSAKASLSVEGSHLIDANFVILQGGVDGELSLKKVLVLERAPIGGTLAAPAFALAAPATASAVSPIPIYKNYWQASARLTHELSEVLSGKMQAKLPILGTKTIFSLPGLNDSAKGPVQWPKWVNWSRRKKVTEMF